MVKKQQESYNNEIICLQHPYPHPFVILYPSRFNPNTITQPLALALPLALTLTQPQPLPLPLALPLPLLQTPTYPVRFAAITRAAPRGGASRLVAAAVLGAGAERCPVDTGCWGNGLCC